MITRIVMMLLFPALILSVAHSQPLEVSRISEEGILETLGLEVKFNCPVINPEQGVQYTSLDDIAPEYEHIRTFLENLAGTYGEFQLIKQIPSAMWGDTLKPRVTDGALVSVIDMSQLYLLHFSDYIPVEEVIEEFLKLSEVEYAHPPVEAVDLADPPNDPLYEDQWNLVRIAADNAWQITHGAENIRIAIIESNELPIRDHPDLINKWHPTIGEQGPGSGDHGTRVAGIIGAETNNEIGIASLARGLMMTRYFFFFPDVGLVDAINRAADSNRVISCSFLTVELHRIPGTDCTIRRPRSYPSVHDAIRNAIRRERIIVGGAGNSKAWLIYRGTCTNEDLSDYFPHAAYPASYGLVEGKWAAVGTTELPSDYPFGELDNAPETNMGRRTRTGCA